MILQNKHWDTADLVGSSLMVTLCTIGYVMLTIITARNDTTR